MSRILLAAIIGIPLAWHLVLTAFAYYDAGRVGLEPRVKWAAITFFIPIFGFFIYLFERSELFYDPEEDPYRGNSFNIHPSRADDTVLASRGDERPPDEDVADSRRDGEDVGDRGRHGERGEWGQRGERSRGSKRGEWGDHDEHGERGEYADADHDTDSDSGSSPHERG